MRAPFLLAVALALAGCAGLGDPATEASTRLAFASVVPLGFNVTHEGTYVSLLVTAHRALDLRLADFEGSDRDGEPVIAFAGRLDGDAWLPATLESGRASTLVLATGGGAAPLRFTWTSDGEPLAFEVAQELRAPPWEGPATGP